MPLGHQLDGWHWPSACIRNHPVIGKNRKNGLPLVRRLVKSIKNGFTYIREISRIGTSLQQQRYQPGITRTHGAVQGIIASGGARVGVSAMAQQGVG